MLDKNDVQRQILENDCRAFSSDCDEMQEVCITCGLLKYDKKNCKKLQKKIMAFTTQSCYNSGQVHYPSDESTQSTLTSLQ